MIESEFDLDLAKGEPLMLEEEFLAQMMSVICWATRVMATGRKAN